MRKTTAIAAAVLSAVLALSALAGCNSSERTARKYIENAKDKYKAVAQANEKLKSQYEKLTTFGQSTQSITPEDIAAMKKGLAEMVALVEAQDKSSQAVRREYEKVLDLDGAARYKEFARTEIKKLSLVDRKASLTKDLAAVAVKVVDLYAAGQTIDEAAIESETKPMVEQLTTVNGQIEKLNEQATRLAEELDL